MKRDYSVVIPALPSRKMQLMRAVVSAAQQTEPIDAIIVEVDHRGTGAWATRNRAMEKVTTTWTAFLDDDDELRPEHARFLLDRAEEHGLDLVWGWFEVSGGTDPFPSHRGRQFDLAEPHIVPITYIVRTDVLRDAVDAMGGFQPDPKGTGAWPVQDQPLFMEMAKRGRHMAFPDVTWTWYHHANNTSGVPSRVR